MSFKRFSLLTVFRETGQWTFIAIALALNAFAFTVGGWHFYRYVVAPNLNLLSDQERWEEAFIVATSPFRLLSEKEQALNTLIEMAPQTPELDDEKRKEVRSGMLNLMQMPDYPLELVYLAAKVNDLYTKSPTAPVEPMDKKPVRLTGDDYQQLAQHIDKTGQDFEAASPERTRLLIELFRKAPCDPKLQKMVKQLQARQTPIVEKSFLTGAIRQSQELCS